MNNEQVNQLIQNLGMMTELWTIAFNGFVSQGLTENVALNHTKAFMSTMMEALIKPAGGGTNEQEVK